MSNSLQFYLDRINPKMITAARELRGFTKKEVASKLGKTPAAITKFEKGTLLPELDTFFSLANILSVPPAFFAKQDQATHGFELADCFFRGKASVTMKEKRIITREGERGSELFVFFQSKGILFPEDNIIKDEQESFSNKEIEAIALHMRNHLGLGFGPIDNLIRTLESNGVFIINLSSNVFQKTDAFSVKSKEHPLIFVNKEQTPSRLLFDIAHELGHIALHEGVEHGAQQEIEANRFASAFLLPWSVFKEECPRRWSLRAFLEMKKRWRVSIAAMLYRAKTLNIISESSFKRAMISLSQQGYKQSEPGEQERETPSLCYEALNLLKETTSFTDITSFLKLSSKETEKILIDQCVSQSLINELKSKDIKHKKTELLRFAP